MFADIDFVSTKARGEFTQKTINRSNADSGQVFRTQIWERVIACLIVTAMLILGGAATINALTGMSTYAASFTWAATLLQSSNVLFAPGASATSVAHASPIPASLPPCSRPRLTQTVSCLSNHP